MFHKRLLAAVLFKRVLYLGEKDYLVHSSGKVEEIGDVGKGRVPLVVLGKKHYFETIKSFPFSGLKDIKSAIETDTASFSPFQSDRFFIKKAKQTNESTKVNLWLIDDTYKEKLRRISPLFIIPETALLSFFDEGSPGIFNIRNEEQTLFVYIEQDGAVRSIFSKDGRFDLQTFRRSVGAGARDCPAREICGVEKYLALFPGILSEMPLKSLMRFANPDYFSRIIDKKQLITGLTLTAALFIIYIGLSASLPYYTNKNLKKEDRALSASLSGLLKKQGSIEIYQQKQKELVKRVNTYTYKLPLINLLNKVLPEETTIRQLVFSGNIVEMRGEAVKASELLGALSGEDRIRNARFTSPLRVDKKTGREIFRLTFVCQGSDAGDQG